MNDLLPFLRDLVRNTIIHLNIGSGRKKETTYRLDGKELSDIQQLEYLECKIRGKIPDNVKCTLRVLFEKQYLKTNVARQIRVEDDTNSNIANYFIRE